MCVKAIECVLKLSSVYLTMLPLRFYVKVGFFLGTDKATTEGGTSLRESGGMLPRRILKIAMQIEPFYSVWARIHYFFLDEN